MITNLKKITILILSAILLLSVFAGCQPTVEPEVPELTLDEKKKEYFEKHGYLYKTNAELLSELGMSEEEARRIIITEVPELPDPEETTKTVSFFGKEYVANYKKDSENWTWGQLYYDYEAEDEGVKFWLTPDGKVITAFFREAKQPPMLDLQGETDPTKMFGTVKDAFAEYVDFSKYTYSRAVTGKDYYSFSFYNNIGKYKFDNVIIEVDFNGKLRTFRDNTLSPLLNEQVDGDLFIDHERLYNLMMLGYRSINPGREIVALTTDYHFCGVRGFFIQDGELYLIMMYQTVVSDCTYDEESGEYYSPELEKPREHGTLREICVRLKDVRE